MAEAAEVPVKKRRPSTVTDQSTIALRLAGGKNFGSQCADNFSLGKKICHAFFDTNANVVQRTVEGNRLEIPKEEGKTCVGVIVLYTRFNGVGHFISYLQINGVWYNGDNEYGYLRKLHEQDIAQLRFYVHYTGKKNLDLKATNYILFYIDTSKITGTRPKIDYSGYPCFGQTKNTCGPDSLQSILMLADGFYETFNEGIFQKNIASGASGGASGGAGSSNLSSFIDTQILARKQNHEFSEGNKTAKEFVLNMIERFRTYGPKNNYTKMENNSPHYTLKRFVILNEIKRDSISCITATSNDTIAFGLGDNIQRISVDNPELSIPPLKGEMISSICVLPDRRIVSGSYDTKLCVWDPATGARLQVLEGHTLGILSICALPDGRIVSGSFDETLRIWNPNTGECLHVLKGHTGYVKGVSALPDGRIVSGSDDMTLRIWDSDTGASLHVLKGHTWRVSSVCVLPDGRIVSGSTDNTLRIWDSATGECLRVLEGHTHWIICVYPLVTSEGQRVVSGSFDNTLRIWNPDTGESQVISGPRDWGSHMCVLPDQRIAIATTEIFILDLNFKGGARKYKRKTKRRKTKRRGKNKLSKDRYSLIKRWQSQE